MTDLKAQGFIEHDGGGMPDCYGRNSYVDVVDAGGVKGCDAAGFYESCGLWAKITHHRPHISEREQLDMAIEALEPFGGDGFPHLVEGGDYGEANQRIKEWFDWDDFAKAIATLKTLRERKPT